MDTASPVRMRVPILSYTNGGGGAFASVSSTHGRAQWGIGGVPPPVPPRPVRHENVVRGGWTPGSPVTGPHNWQRNPPPVSWQSKNHAGGADDYVPPPAYAKRLENPAPFHPPLPKNGRSYWRAEAEKARLEALARATSTEYAPDENGKAEAPQPYLVELKSPDEAHTLHIINTEDDKVMVPDAPVDGPYHRAGVTAGWLVSFNRKEVQSVAAVREEMDAMKLAGTTRFPVLVMLESSEYMQSYLFADVEPVPVEVRVTLDDPKEKHAFKMAQRDGDEGVRIIDLNPGGAYDRAGVPLGMLCAIGPFPTPTSEAITAAVQALQGAGETQFTVKVRPNKPRRGSKKPPSSSGL